jgi:hypothetical protein
MKPKLTIGFPVFRDFDGLYFSACDIPLTHPEIADDVEIIVVDNDPDPSSPFAKATKRWVNEFFAASVRARYVSAPEPGGPALAKQRCMDEASGEFVLVMDSHVRIVKGGLARLLQFYAENPKTYDLHSGPLFYDVDALRAGRGEPLTQFATHMDEVWRGHDLGTWATDPRGAALDAEPFEISAMGAGLFTCRHEAFVGFNPNVRGFGGEEYYLYHKTRQAAGKGVCLPFLRWVHRFGRPGGIPYPLTLWDKVRNYVICHQELGRPLDGIHEHFLLGDKPPMSQKDWEYLLADPVGHTKPPADSGCGTCGGGNPIADDVTLDQLYAQAAKTPSDINEHCNKLKELSAQCKTVVEFGHRRGVSTVALLAGQPEQLTSYDVREDPTWKELQKRQNKTAFQFIQADVTQIAISECDMLFEDSRHTADHIMAILTRHAQKVRRWLVFHDTQIFGETGEDGGPGILPALRRFMLENPEWSVIYHTQANHGLTVLGRLPEDKPKLPSLPKMVWNYAKAIAKHQVAGKPLAGQEMIDSRLNVCSTCPQRTDNRCAVCGCYLDAGPDGAEGKVLWALWGKCESPP